MSDITERLQHAADYFPRIEDNPYSVFVDAKSEIEQLRARLTKHEQAVSVPSILYDGYAVFQEVQHARNSKGLKNIKDSALVSDVLDAVVKLIKQEQGQ